MLNSCLRRMNSAVGIMTVTLAAEPRNRGLICGKAKDLSTVSTPTIVFTNPSVQWVLWALPPKIMRPEL